MPIKMIELQQRYRQLGAIRLGRKVDLGNGKSRPDKLANWRLTSPSGELLAAAAEAYGGDVNHWVDAPTGPNSQYELYTESDTLDVAIPPLGPGASIDTVFSQWMEMWTRGGCTRRCDGEENILDGTPCVCPVDDPEAMKAGRSSKLPTTCAMTTRMSVLLYKVPDLGVWKMETHGYYAAVELRPAVNALDMAQRSGSPQPAKLRIEQRSKTAGGKTSRFIVPVLELPGLTLGRVLSLQSSAPIDVPALPPATVAAAPVAAIEAVGSTTVMLDRDTAETLAVTVEGAGPDVKKALVVLQKQARKSLTADAFAKDPDWAAQVAAVLGSTPSSTTPVTPAGPEVAETTYLPGEEPF